MSLAISPTDTVIPAPVLLLKHMNALSADFAGAIQIQSAFGALREQPAFCRTSFEPSSFSLPTAAKPLGSSPASEVDMQKSKESMEKRMRMEELYHAHE